MKDKDFENQKKENEELSLSGMMEPLKYISVRITSENSQPFRFIKPLILLLALTIAAAQPLIALEEDVSYEGANTAEEVRRLREDLQEAREDDLERQEAQEKQDKKDEFLKELDDSYNARKEKDELEMKEFHERLVRNHPDVYQDE